MLPVWYVNTPYHHPNKLSYLANQHELGYKNLRSQSIQPAVSMSWGAKFKTKEWAPPKQKHMQNPASYTGYGQ